MEDEFDLLDSTDKYNVEQITLQRLNESYLWVQASDSVCQTLGEHFSFLAEGYKWNPKYKSRMWDGRIRLFNRKFDTLPLGLFGQLKEFLASSGATIEEENFHDAIDPKALEEDFDRFYKTLVLREDLELRDYQRTAILESLGSRRGIIISPTGSGKSLIIYCILRYGLSRALFRKTLLVVPTINLVTQMFKDFKDYSSEDPGFDVNEMCHQIYGGKDKDSKKAITISTWQSMDQIKGTKFFGQFDGLIVDEVHLAESKGMTRIVESSIKAPYKIGLTGTLKESRMNPLALIGLFGEIINTKKTHELMDEGILAKTPVQALILEYSEAEKKSFWADIEELRSKQQTQKIFAREMKFLIENRKRNMVILRLCQRLPSMNTLILFRNIVHIDEVEKLLKKEGIDVKRMSSDMSPEEREEIRTYTENHLGVVVLSTFQLFQLGINIKNLHNLLFGAPAKGRIRVLQSFGRIIRPSPDGRVGWLLDLIDDLRTKSKVNHTWAHGLKRLQYYSEEKLKIKYKKVPMR